MSHKTSQQVRIQELRRYFRWVDERNRPWIIRRNYQWLVRKYLPALEDFQRLAHTRKDRWLLSNAFYYLGDCYFFCDAPRAAIVAFETSIGIDPENYSSYRELGWQHATLGHRRKGRACFFKAIAMNPSDERATEDLKVWEESWSEGPGEVAFRRDDAYWKARELLCRHRPMDALSLLKGLQSLDAVQHRIACYGAEGNLEGFMAEMRALAESEGEFQVEFFFWWFMPDIVWNCADFWRIWSRCASRISCGWLCRCPFSAVSTSGHPIRTRIGSKAQDLWLQRRVRLYAEFQIARIEGDIKKARTLAAKYPNWVEVADLAGRLMNTSRGMKSGGVGISNRRIAPKRPADAALR